MSLVACRFLVLRSRKCRYLHEIHVIYLTYISRCFLFLVNYARMKPEVAIKALPVLVLVGDAPKITLTPSHQR